MSEGETSVLRLVLAIGRWFRNDIARDHLKTLGIKGYQALELISKWPACMAVVLMAVIVIGGVLSRYVFESPLYWVEEYNGYLQALVTLLPLAWVLMHSGHIRLTLVTQFLPQRAAGYHGLVTSVISLGVIIWLTIATTQVAIGSFVDGTRAFTVQLTPLGPVQLLMPVGLGLFAIAIMVDIGRKVRALGTRSKNAQEEIV